METALFLFYV